MLFNFPPKTFSNITLITYVTNFTKARNKIVQHTKMEGEANSALASVSAVSENVVTASGQAIIVYDLSE